MVFRMRLQLCFDRFTTQARELNSGRVRLSRPQVARVLRPAPRIDAQGEARAQVHNAK